MNVHYKINPSTVDKGKLPTHLTANTVMRQVSRMLWEANKDDPHLWHDYWANSTPRTGIRSLRVRFMQSEATGKVWQQVLDLLAPYEGMYKIYPWQYTPIRKFTCIMLYYRSWQAGDPRTPPTIQECAPGYELLHKTGTRISFKGCDDTVKTGKIIRRYSYGHIHPYYKVAIDEPPTGFPYNKAWDGDKFAKVYITTAHHVMQEDVISVL